MIVLLWAERGLGFEGFGVECESLFLEQQQ
jgi:hypothetical protein